MSFVMSFVMSLFISLFITLVIKSIKISTLFINMSTLSVGISCFSCFSCISSISNDILLKLFSSSHVTFFF